MTPLHVAAERGGRSNIVEYLVGKEADINSKDHNGVNIGAVVHTGWKHESNKNQSTCSNFAREGIITD